MATLLAVNQSRGQETPSITVEPSSLDLATAHLGQTIQINITVNNVHGLWGWDIKDIRFNSSILNLTQVTEGPFLKTGGQTFFLWTSGSNAAFLQGDIPEILDALAQNSSVSGSGVLATLEFQVLSSGNSPITLTTTQLSNAIEYTPDSTVTGWNEQINHTTVNGNVNIAQLESAQNTDLTLSTPLYVEIGIVVTLAVVTTVFVLKRRR